jgi:hypothetical protein
MDCHVPNFVSYEMLLRAVCCRPVTGRSNDEIQYIVELAEALCRLMREVEEATRLR